MMSSTSNLLTADDMDIDKGIAMASKHKENMNVMKQVLEFISTMI